MTAPGLPPLAFPEAALQTRTDAAGRAQVCCLARRRWVRLTPEEWVRQHLLAYLGSLGYPAGLVAVEKEMAYLGLAHRADVVVHDRRARPWLLAECKAPDVPIAQTTFEQAARYNTVARAPYLAVTNGLDTYCAHVDFATGRRRFLDGFPAFPDRG